MVKYTAIAASNAQIKSTLPQSPTAVFAGSTAGIGYEAMKAFVANFASPTIYFLGRSQSTGDRVIEELKPVNPNAKYEFLAGDLTLMHEVKRIGDAIVEKTQKSGVDYVFLSPGYLDFSGRQETKEGLDALLNIRYYSRLFLLHILFTSLPPTKIPKHVNLVLAAGTENTLILDDLDLKKPNNYGIISCANHSSTMQSLAIEHLASIYKDTSFVHSYPGLVKTRQLTEWVKTGWIKWLMDWVLTPLLTPFTTGLEDVGNRCLYYLTSKQYPSWNGQGDKGKADGIEVGDGVKVSPGKGAHLVYEMSDPKEGKVMKQYREDGTREKVWEHSLGIWEAALKKSI